MDSNELRRKFLNFFQDRGHQIIPSAPLVPAEKVELAGTQRVLFTTAGMHPLIPYLLGEPHPEGKRLVNVQKCIRTDDIDEVGDSVHNTFFEMLGNWSLGDYWKEEAITWSYEFLINELKLDAKRIYVSVFAGDKDAPFDEESFTIWKKLGVHEDHIFKYGKKDNWWGPVGEVGPCGPDTEMFYDLNPQKAVIDPASDSTRFVEIWNDVFMEYDKQKDGSFKSLKQKNVDTGMGLERMLMVLQGKGNVYDTELFKLVIDLLNGKSKYPNLKAARIVADHMRAATFIASEGVKASNKDQGYILRRLIRRSEAKSSYSLGIASFPYTDIINFYINYFKNDYPELVEKRREIEDTVLKEVVKFHKALEQSVKEFEKIREKSGGEISGKDAFYLHATHGLTIDIVKDWAIEEGFSVDEKGFEEEFTKHKDVSRAGMEKKFVGGLADTSDISVRGHTATHLLHQALRDVLGVHVYQTGSNITPERIRFDFSHSEKLTEDQIKKVEEIVNQKIKENLKVTKEFMSQEDAEKLGAIGLFKEKYAGKVSIYKIGDYSIEYCGGPHVESTGELRSFRIVKEESQGSGARRIYGRIG